MMKAQLNYQAFNKLIDEQKWWFTASECHGLLTALICFNQFDAWSNILFKDIKLSELLQKVFIQMGQKIEADLQNNELLFQLLIPQNLTLQEKAEALIFWAEGFIIASNHTNQHYQVKLDKNGQEFINDLQEIIRLDTNLANNEENHRLLTDLEEHCRMGALLIYADTHTK